MKKLTISNYQKIKQNKISDFAVQLESNITDFVSKVRLKRNRANARERCRMHCLNKALDRLRESLVSVKITVALDDAQRSIRN